MSWGRSSGRGSSGNWGIGVERNDGLGKASREALGEASKSTHGGTDSRVHQTQGKVDDRGEEAEWESDETLSGVGESTSGLGNAVAEAVDAGGEGVGVVERAWRSFNVGGDGPRTG